MRNTVLLFSRADSLGLDPRAEGLDHAVTVQANLALVEGILNNLLDNALRYGRGTPPRINVSLRTQADNCAVICVADNGPGVGPDLAGQL